MTMRTFNLKAHPPNEVVHANRDIRITIRDLDGPCARWLEHGSISSVA